MVVAVVWLFWSVSLPWMGVTHSGSAQLSVVLVGNTLYYRVQLRAAIYKCMPASIVSSATGQSSDGTATATHTALGELAAACLLAVGRRVNDQHAYLQSSTVATVPFTLHSTFRRCATVHFHSKVTL